MSDAPKQYVTPPVEAQPRPVVAEYIAPVKVDRSVSFGLLLALAVQTAGAMFWAGAVDTRLKGVEHAIEQTPEIGQRLARLEAQSNSNHELLLRMEVRLNDMDHRQ